jgi:hypothetical protein
LNRSESIAAIAAALSKAQMEISNPPLDAVNPHFKNRYASLGAHLSSVREPLSKQGIALLQGVSTTANGGVAVTTMLVHSSGEWMSSEVSMSLPDRATAQQLGSVVTYLRRYSIAGMTMIVGEEEDDGEADRVERTTRPSEPTKYSYPAQSKPQPPKPVIEAAVPASPKKPEAPDMKSSLKDFKKWADKGTDVLLVEKVVERGNNQSAVLCSHATEGRQWVCVPNEMLQAIKVGKALEFDWEWNKSGFYLATRVAPASKPTKSETESSVPLF